MNPYAPVGTDATAPIAPIYSGLKALHLTTSIVEGRRAISPIVAPASGVHDRAAATIQEAVRRAFGVTLPVVADDAPEARVPLTGHAIVLGNRSTSRTLSALYDRFFTFVDLKYPGPGGHVLQSLHNPFGNGRNAIVVGGSDAAGVQAAAEALATRVREPTGRDLVLGWLQDIRLPEGTRVPESLEEACIWEASRDAGSTGCFGWNCLSRRMALYYMTGDPFHAREFIRLAFPDEQAVREIDAADQENIENKRDPLAGPYHYAAHTTVLLWDLIEESPVFTDEERLAVTNALSRQLEHRRHEGVLGIDKAPPFVGDRHRDWSATALYALARYFARDYPAPIWDECLAAVKLYYSTLNETSWLAGQNDHLFWYNTYFAPIFSYILLSGETELLESGNLQQALRTQDILFSGNVPDWALFTAPLSYLTQAAHLTGDGRFLYYLGRCELMAESGAYGTGERRGGQESATDPRDAGTQEPPSAAPPPGTIRSKDAFRLGQSFWPGPELAPRRPQEMEGTWTVQPMPKAMWEARRSPIPHEQAFLWACYRTSCDETGDLLQLKGHNGTGRNPYHTFAVLELRLDGVSLLADYHNQVLTGVDGMVEPAIGLDAGLVHTGVVGPTAMAVGSVPQAGFCEWRRTIALRGGAYALFADRLRFRQGRQRVKIATTWEPVGSARPSGDGVELCGDFSRPVPDGWMRMYGLYDPDGAVPGPSRLGRLPQDWVRFPALEATCETNLPAPDRLARLVDSDVVLLKSRDIGDRLQMAFCVEQEVAGTVFADLLGSTDRGTVRIYLDGEVAVEAFDHYEMGWAEHRVPLGQKVLRAGVHVLTVEVIGRRPGEDKCYVGLQAVTVRPEGVPTRPVRPHVYELHTCDGAAVVQGQFVKSHWCGTVAPGDEHIAFHLIGKRARGSEEMPACRRIAPNAAALRLPQPALATVGDYASCHGELCLIAADHLHGRAVTRMGLDCLLVEADNPIDIDWDFVTGEVHLDLTADTEVRLVLARDMQGHKASSGQYPTTEAHDQFLPAGAHVMYAARMDPDTAANLADGLAALLPAPTRRPAAGTARPGPRTPTPAYRAALGTPVTALLATPIGVCAAAGEALHILQRPVRVVLETGSPIRAACWWEEAELLLTGCADDRVLALGPEGRRRWEFVSEMDPAVYETGKQYWFRAAHPGIHGLGSGVFLRGQPQAFVGSACTLEILDPDGQLCHRMPVFWGPGRQFTLIDSPSGGRDLLIARWPNDGEHLAVLNSETLGLSHGFFATPPGHTQVNGWTAMNRVTTFYEDLDGSGRRVILSAINGVANRVTSWDVEGTPLHNAQFIPGEKAPAVTLADMDIGDADGDGRQEVFVACQDGSLVALDCGLATRWSLLFEAPPRSVAYLPEPRRIVVGCDDGGLWTVDGEGRAVALGQMTGRPMRLLATHCDGAPAVAVGTDAGELAVFEVGA